VSCWMRVSRLVGWNEEKSMLGVTSTMRAVLQNPTKELTMLNLSEQEPRWLTDLDEARGELLRVHELEGFCIAIFSWGGISIPGEFAPKLCDLVGKNVGILHLDGYHIRDLDGDGHTR
jgi:hypothetical protein